MAKAKQKQIITKLDVKNQYPFKTHAEILNKVFNKKNRAGKPYKLYLRGGLRITPHQCCTFIHLAEKTPEGGWLPAKSEKNWLNIPNSKGSTFTQIQLNKKNDGFFEKIAGINEWAFFRKEKGLGYYFYGIFELVRKDKRGVCVYKRKSTVLYPAKWV